MFVEVERWRVWWCCLHPPRPHSRSFHDLFPLIEMRWPTCSSLRALVDMAGVDTIPPHCPAMPAATMARWRRLPRLRHLRLMRPRTGSLSAVKEVTGLGNVHWVRNHRWRHRAVRRTSARLPAVPRSQPSSRRCSQLSTFEARQRNKDHVQKGCLRPFATQRKSTALQLPEPEPEAAQSLMSIPRITQDAFGVTQAKEGTKENCLT